jgi:hypothetical protein
MITLRRIRRLLIKFEPLCFWACFLWTYKNAIVSVKYMKALHAAYIYYRKVVHALFREAGLQVRFFDRLKILHVIRIPGTDNVRLK